MSAGEKIDQAHKQAARATGRLSLILAQKRISRGMLEASVSDLEEAVRTIKSVLTPNGGGGTVTVPNPNEGEDDGAQNARG